MKTITLFRSFLVAALFLWLQPSQVFSAAFTKGNLVVIRVANADAGWQSVYLDEYTPSGILVQTVALPDANTASGNNRPIGINCQSAQDGTLNLSADKNYLLMAGYKTGLNSVLSTDGNTRIVATVDKNATINTTTELSDIGTSNWNFKSVVSTNGTDLWLSGQFGIGYTTVGATKSLIICVPNIINQGIYDNKLYMCSGVGTYFLASMDNGLPTTRMPPNDIWQTYTALAGNSAPAPNIGIVYPMAFVMFDIDPGIPGVDVLYVAEYASTTSRGLAKYCLDGNGLWVKTGVTIPAPIATNGLKGLTGVYDSATGAVTLFATTVSTTLSEQTSIVTHTDNTGYNGALAGTLTNVVTSASGTAFRGIAITPGTTTIKTAVNNVFENAALSVSAYNGKIKFTAIQGEKLEVYTALGQKLLSKVTVDGVNEITLASKGVMIVKVGNKIGKVTL